MTYVYASRMGKTEKLIEKLAIDAMKIENGTETVKGDYILFTYTDGNGVVPNIVESFLENNPDGLKGVVAGGKVFFIPIFMPQPLAGRGISSQKNTMFPVFTRSMVRAVKRMLRK